VKFLFFFLLFFLSGCAFVSVDVEYDKLGAPMACTAYYSTLFKDIDSGSYVICGGSAKVGGSRADMTLLELLKAIK